MPEILVTDVRYLLFLGLFLYLVMSHHLGEDKDFCVKILSFLAEVHFLGALIVNYNIAITECFEKSFKAIMRVRFCDSLPFRALDQKKSKDFEVRARLVYGFVIQLL